MGFVIKPVAATASTVKAVDVPDEVRDSLEGFWDYLRSHPGDNGYVKFDRADEVDPFIAQAKAWAAGRTVQLSDDDDAETVPAPLVFRKLPGKNTLTDTEIRFSLALPPTAEEIAAAKAKRAANKAAKAATETVTETETTPNETAKPGPKAKAS